MEGFKSTTDKEIVQIAHRPYHKRMRILARWELLLVACNSNVIRTTVDSRVNDVVERFVAEKVWDQEHWENVEC